MKKINILLSALFVLGFASCQDGDWDNNINEDYTIGNDTITERQSAIISIKDLKNKYKKAIQGTGKYSNNSVQLIEEDLQLQGWVTINDEGGNTSQEIVLIDDSQESIIVSIADNDIMTYLRIGQKILVNLQGLYIGGYSGTPQIGYPNEKYGSEGTYRMSFMSRFLWYKHFKSIGEPDLTKVPDAVALTKNTDTWAYCSRLLYIDGHFSNDDGNTKIADPSKVSSTDTANGVNEVFKTDNGVAVTVRTSTYADFAAHLIPAANVRIYGIACWSTYDGGYWQWSLRDADDIAIHCAKCDAWIGSTHWTKNSDGDYVCQYCGTIVKKI